MVIPVDFDVIAVVLVLETRGYQKIGFENQHSYWRSSDPIPETYSIFSSIAQLAWSPDVYNQVLLFRATLRSASRAAGLA